MGLGAVHFQGQRWTGNINDGPVISWAAESERFCHDPINFKLRGSRQHACMCILIHGHRKQAAATCVHPLMEAEDRSSRISSPMADLRGPPDGQHGEPTLKTAGHHPQHQCSRANKEEERSIHRSACIGGPPWRGERRRRRRRSPCSSSW